MTMTFNRWQFLRMLIVAAITALIVYDLASKVEAYFDSPLVDECAEISDAEGCE